MIGVTVGESGKRSLTIMFFVNIFMKFAMNKILSQVQNQAMIVHFMILQLNYAAICSFYFGLLIEFVTFDIFPMEEIHAFFFNLQNIEWST